jgi:hypothetical protein
VPQENLKELEVEEELALEEGSGTAPGPECLLAAKLLLEVVGEPHPDVALQVRGCLAQQLQGVYGASVCAVTKFCHSIGVQCGRPCGGGLSAKPAGAPTRAGFSISVLVLQKACARYHPHKRYQCFLALFHQPPCAHPPTHHPHALRCCR